MQARIDHDRTVVGSGVGFVNGSDMKRNPGRTIGALEQITHGSGEGHPSSKRDSKVHEASGMTREKLRYQGRRCSTERRQWFLDAFIRQIPPTESRKSTVDVQSMYSGIRPSGIFTFLLMPFCLTLASSSGVWSLANIGGNSKAGSFSSSSIFHKSAYGRGPPPVVLSDAWNMDNTFKSDNV